MVTKFKDTYKDYKSYSDHDLLMTKLTPRLISEVSKVLLMGLRKKVNSYKPNNKYELENSLKKMCDIICDYSNKERTSSWGWYFYLRTMKRPFSVSYSSL